VEDKNQMIYDCAKELFSAKGFKDTAVSEITRCAGVAVGTFYNYYPSKEKLFMEIFLAENEALKKRCLAALDLNQAPPAVARQMIALNLAGMQANPILREWFNSSAFAKLEQLFREEGGVGAVSFLYDSFLPIVGQWQAQGKMRSDMDPKMIMALFAAIVNAETHKEEIGLEYFPEVLDYLTQFVMDGLTDCAQER